MQLCTTLFGAKTQRAVEVALAVHNSGDEGVVIFTGSRDNCRSLMRALKAWGGDVAANRHFKINNTSGLTAEMIDNRDGEIVQRSNELEAAPEAAQIEDHNLLMIGRG